MRVPFAKTASKKLAYFAGLSLLLLAVATVSWVPTIGAAEAECGPNAVIYCGFTSSTQFVNKIKANIDQNGDDLPTIFNYFGLQSSEHNRFVSTAKNGTVYKDGRVVVDGQTVMSNAKSLGRTTLGGRHDKSLKIGTETYYYGLTSRVFLSNSLPVKVMFDNKGEVELAVITTCGNPVWGTNVESSAKCDALKKAAVADKLGAYNFTTSASATGNAKITKYVYDFGDGKPITTTQGTKAVPHTFAPGTHKVKVTVYATVPGGGTVTSTCETMVTVEEPPKPKPEPEPVVPFYSCVAETGLAPEGLKYTFTAKAKYGNGATFVNADFNFGDGNTVSAVKPTTADSVTAVHTFAKSGTYDVSVVLRFSVNGKMVLSDTCKWVVKPAAPPVPECRPGIPVGDARCEPCQYDASLPADDPRCVPAVVTETLPNTGAGNIIALSSAALVGGFLFYRHRAFQRNKAAFHAAENGTSPLPLADPLAPEDPLAHTPLEPEQQQPVRSTLRRRRPF